MQRLVDLDYIRDRFNVAERCNDCGRDARYCNGGLYGHEDYTARDICGVLDDTPIIEAIPIEWLKQKYAENDPNGGNEEFDRYLWDSICYVLTAWKEEREDVNDAFN